MFGNLNSSSNRVYLGAAEAEAESGDNASMPLKLVYEDCHNLFSQLSNEKFILIGRKGAGKSAFANYTQIISEKEPNLFVDFIQKDKANLEELVQIGAETEQVFEKESLFKWLIYTHIIGLFTQHESAKNHDGYYEINRFLQINTGFIKISQSQIKEQIIANKGEVEISSLNKFFRINKKNEHVANYQKACFYKLIPSLEEVIKILFTSEEEVCNENSYVIFFDDLDLGFDINNQSSVDSVVHLLRICKSINNTIFAKKNIKAKVIILLRDDVEKYIIDKYPDTAKIFSSYSVKINWYQGDFIRPNEINDLYIKKFINKRIKQAFKRANLPCKNTDPWYSLVDQDKEYKFKGSSFEYVLSHTLYRPRDLLLFFNPISDGTINLPLDKSAINKLIGKYSISLIQELKNELSSFYSRDEISNLFKVLEDIFNSEQCSFEKACNFICKNCGDNVNCKEILNDMFDRSIIGNMPKETNNVTFKYREPPTEIYKLNIAEDIVMHFGFIVYFKNKEKTY